MRIVAIDPYPPNDLASLFQLLILIPVVSEPHGARSEIKAKLGVKACS